LLNAAGAIVLYFYPADFTPGCTRQACSLRDLHAEIRKAGLLVAGISPQSAESHARFRDKYNLPFTLLSDQHKAVNKNVWGQRTARRQRQTRLIPR